METKPIRKTMSYQLLPEVVRAVSVEATLRGESRYEFVERALKRELARCRKQRTDRAAG